MPTQLETYGCPLCFINFEWNKAGTLPPYCPHCTAAFSPRNIAADLPEVIERMVNPLAGKKGGFSIGGFVS
jgi:hypothetical protein